MREYSNFIKIVIIAIALGIVDYLKFEFMITLILFIVLMTIAIRLSRKFTDKEEKALNRISNAMPRIIFAVSVFAIGYSLILNITKYEDVTSTYNKIECPKMFSKSSVAIKEVIIDIETIKDIFGYFSVTNEEQIKIEAQHRDIESDTLISKIADIQNGETIQSIMWIHGRFNKLRNYCVMELLGLLGIIYIVANAKNRTLRYKK